MGAPVRTTGMLRTLLVGVVAIPQLAMPAAVPA
jgi:hypothetical protein